MRKSQDIMIKKSIDIVAQMLQENDITPEAISISFR